VITGEQVYCPDFTPDQTKLTLTGSEFHHLVRVRRFQLGQDIWVVNGHGSAALCQISSRGSATLDLTVLKPVAERGELPTRLILAIANLKRDHLELVVEKATELGVHTIVPLLTEYTVKKGINQSRLERIAIAAMKQSRRSRLPMIQDLTPFKVFVEHNPTGAQLFCYAHDQSEPLLQRLGTTPASEQVTIWIGPEGDWSQDEIDLASVSDYTFTGLGPRRLRAETAAIHAVGLAAAFLQDLASYR